MGYAVRTERYRYVEWREWETKDIVARELYDHTVDPRESRNIANQPAHDETMMRLAEILESGPDSVVPAQTE
jgi:iduronate 2-sulfatase